MLHKRPVQARDALSIFRKLEPEEVKAYQDKGKGERKLIEEQYDAILGDYAIGDYGEGVLDNGEKRLTVRHRLKAAAGRRDVAIHFRRTTGDVLRFQIIAKSEPVPIEPPPVVSSEPPAKPKGKGGRPKKSA
jgi:hypothetical protein